MSSIKVIVCILTDDSESDKIKQLYNLFENDIFDINVYDISPPGEAAEKEVFNYRLNWCLNDVEDKDEDAYLLVVQDDVICSAESNILAKLLREIINYNNGEQWVDGGRGDAEKAATSTSKKWDVLYLSAWGDDCKKYQKVADIRDHNMYVAKTGGPQGSSAFVLAPEYRQRLIDNKLSKAENSLIVLPTPFIVDPVENGGSHKLNLQRVGRGGRFGGGQGQGWNGNNEEVNYISFVWFFGIVIFCILIAWVLIRFR